MKRVLLWAACGVWFLGVATAMVLVWRYKTTDSGPPVAPATWPVKSTIARGTQTPSLIVFAHPQCPCTRATMTELAQLAVELRGRAELTVMLVRPDGAEPGFEEGDIADRARRIPGVKVATDIGGAESKRFGATASGSVVVYSTQGTLMFRGGITTARGHEGRSASSDRILALVAGEGHGAAAAPTFGCGLAEVDRTPAARTASKP